MPQNTRAGAAPASFADAVAAFATETFTADELAWALAFRQSVTPHASVARRDRCPHAALCPDVPTCVRYIAWYRRHQRAIEGAAA